MTISELITKLEDMRSDYGEMPVKLTWESVERDVTDSNLHVLNYTLWIDADHNSAFPDVQCACSRCTEATAREVDWMEQ